VSVNLLVTEIRGRRERKRDVGRASRFVLRETMFWLMAMRNRFPRFALQHLCAVIAVAIAGQIAPHALHAQSAAAQITPGQSPSASLRQADAVYREGMAALNRNDLPAAQAKFEQVVRLAPSAEQGHAALGVVLQRAGQMAAAIAEYAKALAIKPGDTSVQLNLAEAYEQIGNPAKALPLYAKAAAAARAEKKPLAPGVLSAYARALAASGQATAAIARMKEASGQEPGNPQLRDELGTFYAQAQDWAHAEQEFAEAVRLKPDFAAAHLHLGFVFQAEHKGDAAQEWLQASRLAPQDASVALMVGTALAEADLDEQAAPILERAHELAPQSTGAAYQLALVLQRVNRLDDAIGLLKGVVEAEPKNADALINLGLALTQAHKARDAAPFLQRAIGLKPDDATAHQDLAAAYLQVNETADAIVELQAALKLAPDSPQLHYDLGAAYKIEDDAVHAIPELETAARLDSNAYEPHYLLGVLYMQEARYDEAAPHLEASLKLHSQNGDGWATLGSVYNKLDRLPEAVSALREAIKQLPDQADPHLTLAAVLVKQKQTAEAAEERKMAANLMRAHMNFQRAEVATNSGKSLMTAGKIDDAIVEFRNAIGFDPEYAEAHVELGKALEIQGKSAEAATQQQCVKALAKSSDQATDLQAIPSECAQ
jgi:protein O-GlcNAc transferase